ncbi:hypothetical protein ACFPRL_27220 [Pseudoclavibacter helvolus]
MWRGDDARLCAEGVRSDSGRLGARRVAESLGRARHTERVAHARFGGRAKRRRQRLLPEHGR